MTDTVLFLPPVQHFAHCPRCGIDAASTPGTNFFHCSACGFRLYFNVACAYAGLIVNEQGEMLFIRRAKEPSRGKLAVPGGFADANETAEEGLRREVREEVGLKVGMVTYLCSHPNEYRYREVAYSVLDFFFVCRLPDGEGHALTLQKTEVSGVEWRDPQGLNPDEIAFPSLRFALLFYLAQHSKTS
jgi:mutator protein MutT